MGMSQMKISWTPKDGRSREALVEYNEGERIELWTGLHGELSIVKDNPASIPCTISMARHDFNWQQRVKVPTDVGDHWDIFEQWGFNFGEVDSKDPQWRDANLPAGWAIVSDTDMWSIVQDNKGRRRATIKHSDSIEMYPDDWATVVGTFIKGKSTSGELQVSAAVNGKILYTAHAKYEGPRRGPGELLAEAEAKQECWDWLDRVYPDHRDPIKAWEYNMDAPTRCWHCRNQTSPRTRMLLYTGDLGPDNQEVIEAYCGICCLLDEYNQQEEED